MAPTDPPVDPPVTVEETENEEEPKKATPAPPANDDPASSITTMPESALEPPPPPPTNTAEETAQESNDSSSTTTMVTPPNPTSSSPSKNQKDNHTIQLPMKSVQTASERSKDFHELRSYEAKRRSIYASKLKSTSIYWRSYRKILTDSYQETDRVENLIRGAFVANQAYAKFLRAAAEDRLDHNGKPVEGKRVSKMMQMERQKRGVSLQGGLTMKIALDAAGVEVKKKKNDNDTNHNHNNTNTNAHEHDAMTEEKGKSDSNHGLTEDTMIHGLVTSHAAMADVFQENIDFVKDVTLVKVVELRKELEAEVHVMTALGDTTLYELNRAEKDVQKAWAAYYALASLTDGQTVSPRVKRDDKGADPNAITDVWLVEMHYRMAVAYLTTVWDKSSKELATLFAGVKEMEYNRRVRQHELLVLFQKKTETLFNGLPPIISSVLQDLEGIPTENEVVEKAITEQIKTSAHEFQKADELNPSPDPMNGPGLAGVPEIRKDFELQSPLMSDLLAKVDVIWRKSDKVMAVWKPCLAVMTTDGYLHLFEFPAVANVSTGTAAEVAFQALVPPVTVPTEESIVEGFNPSAVSWFQHLIPGSSLDLKNCNISFDQQKGNSTFDITETMAPSGLSKLNKNASGRRRKFSLRLYSGQHMVEWLLALRELGAD
jgi:hypothetical protein